MQDRPYADRSEQQGRVQILTEDAHRKVARIDATQHPRHDSPASEGPAVLAYRILRAGAAIEIIEGRRIDGFSCALTKLRQRNGLLRTVPAQTAQEDLHLPLHSSVHGEAVDVLTVDG